MKELLLNEAIYTEVVENGMMKARHSVWIATANVKNMFVALGAGAVGSSIELFERLAARGVRIRLLHSGVPSGSFLSELKERRKLLHSPNFDMRRCVRVHFKCVLIDSRKVYVGSANFTGAGIGMKGRGRRNFEIGMMSGEDRVMDQIAALYDAIWNGAKCRKCGRRKHCIVPLESPKTAG